MVGRRYFIYFDAPRVVPAVGESLKTAIWDSINFRCVRLLVVCLIAIKLLSMSRLWPWVLCVCVCVCVHLCFCDASS